MRGYRKKIAYENQEIRFLCKTIAAVPIEHPSVEDIGREQPEVVLRESKDYFRRGTEKLPIQVFLSVE